MCDGVRHICMNNNNINNNSSPRPSSRLGVAAMTAASSTPLLIVLVISICDVILDVGLNGCAAAATGKQRLRYSHYDALFVARCEAHCWRTQNKSSCMKTCLHTGFQKPGLCPSNVEDLSPFAAVCLDACQYDSQCPGLTKCCRHNCGVTCQQSQHLLEAVGVPEIPRDVRVTEGKRKRTIILEWKPEEYSFTLDGRVVYVIEERHHAGRNFVEKKLSEWTPCARSTKTTQTLRNFVKPGRWYQFRVAAVNENGTKGFSESSATFSISLSPKPPKPPQNMTVGPLWVSNGSLNAELRWSPSLSDLPIQRYKVFWSRRLHGATALDSVLVNQRYVPKEQTSFMLHNLQPNSLYFLQVQALVQYGKDRLKSEKSGLVLNTTNYTNVTDNNVFVDYNKNGIEGLHLQKLFWAQGGLRARISWKAKKGPIKYTVSWWSGPCQQNNKGYSQFKLAATTKASHFDLFDLHFNCRYRVSVREISAEGMKFIQDTSVTFTTPSCNDFRSNYRKVKCIHE